MTKKKLQLKNLEQPTAKKGKRRIEDIEAFLRYQKRFSERTIKTEMPRVKRIIEFYAVGIPTQEDAIRVEEGQRKEGNSDTTVIHYLKALKYLAEYHGVTLKIKMPKPIKKKPLELSPPECRALIDATLNIRDRCIIAILLYCGLRNSELISLRVGDIDIKSGFLYVRDHGQGIKSGRERMAAMPRDCCRIVEDYLIARMKAGIDYETLFFTETGQQMTPHRLQIIVKEIARRSNIGKRITPHGLRHACAALMLKYARVPVTEVSLQLGHAEVSTTVNYYLSGNYYGLKRCFEDFII